jgi:DNA repair protein RadC
VLLDAQLRYLMHTEISVGTLTASLVHPREVFGPAIREGAASIVLIHNHPSGDATPSREDLRLTRQLCEGGKLLDVPVHDHVIVGNGTDDWVSLAERGLL